MQIYPGNLEMKFCSILCIRHLSLSPYIFILRFNEILLLWSGKRLLYIFIVQWSKIASLFKWKSYSLFCCLRNWICVFSSLFGHLYFCYKFPQFPRKCIHFHLKIWLWESILMGHIPLMNVDFLLTIQGHILDVFFKAWLLYIGPNDLNSSLWKTICSEPSIAFPWSEIKKGRKKWQTNMAFCLQYTGLLSSCIYLKGA